MQPELQAMSDTHDIRLRFDKVINKHVVPALEAGVVPPGFSLDMTTLVCLVIFAERQSEIQSGLSDSPEPFTEETFCRELEDLGINLGSKVEEKIEAMLAGGFIKRDPLARLTVLDPTMIVARSLEKAFPGMPGMNFVAYLVQTLDEALCGRKDPGFAIRQLEQTLEAQRRTDERPITPLERSKRSANGSDSAQELKSALSATLQKRRQARRQADGARVSGQPRIVTADGTVKTAKIQEVFSKRPSMDEPQAPEKEEPCGPGTPAEEREPTVDPRTLGPEDAPAADQDQTEPFFDQGRAPEPEVPDPVEQATPVAQEASADQVSTPPDNEPADGPLPETSAQEAAPASPSFQDADHPVEEQEQDSRQEESPQTIGPPTETADLSSDEVLEARISAFEQDLAMKCPMCSKGRIQQKQTAKKKTFYVCDNPECVFVSWGKPYHMACPRCNNPFLIEVPKAKKTFLRCPRATCRHEQALSEDAGPVPERPHHAATQTTGRPRKKRRVVRRRVVRKRR